MSTDRTSKPTGIMLDGCKDVVATGNKFFGDMNGIKAVNSTVLDFSHNTHYTEQVTRLFNDIDATAHSLNGKISEGEIAKLRHAIDEMKESYGEKDFGSKYANFISLLSDHVTVMTAFAPILAPLAQLAVS